MVETIGYCAGMLSELFDTGPYGFRMRFKRGTLADFYGRSREHDSIIQQRREILSDYQSRAFVYLPEADPFIEETIEVAREGGFLPVIPSGSPRESALSLGGQWECDYLVMQPHAELHFRLVCGCVCFPSSWDVREKIGRGLGEIHGVVPGLNNSIGSQINTFLSRMKPGTSWDRVNWGLSRRPDFDQHPERNLPRLHSEVLAEEVFLRIEEQSLTPLPRTGGVLFGIRIVVFPLTGILKDEPGRKGLLNALTTMPEEMAQYKGVSSARRRVIELLGPL